MNKKLMYLSPSTDVLEVQLSSIIAASNISDREDFVTDDLIFDVTVDPGLMF